MAQMDFLDCLTSKHGSQWAGWDNKAVYITASLHEWYYQDSFRARSRYWNLFYCWTMPTILSMNTPGKCHQIVLYILVHPSLHTLPSTPHHVTSLTSAFTFAHMRSTSPSPLLILVPLSLWRGLTSIILIVLLELIYRSSHSSSRNRFLAHSLR